MDVIVKLQWSVLQTWCCAIISALVVIVQLYWCVLQACCIVIIISTMDVIVKVEWCVLQSWGSVICSTAGTVHQYGGERNINPRPSYIRACYVWRNGSDV